MRHRFNHFLWSCNINIKCYIYAVFLSLLINAHSSAAIFGDGNPANGIEDQRLLAPNKLQHSVGTIICDGGLRGTAVHVVTNNNNPNQQRSIILTAAHILYHPDTHERYEKCAYHPQGKRLNGIAFAKVSAHDFRPTINNKMVQAIEDIVFIALKKKLRYSGMKLNLTGQNSSQLQLLGFNESQNNISMSIDCRPFLSRQFVSAQLLLHDCDAGRGASGGPLIDAKTGVVVGIHGGTLLFSPPGTKKIHATAGAFANPETLINQARKIDVNVLTKLREFTAYPAKGFQY